MALIRPPQIDIPIRSGFNRVADHTRYCVRYIGIAVDSTHHSHDQEAPMIGIARVIDPEGFAADLGDDLMEQDYFDLSSWVHLLSAAENLPN